MPAKGLAEASGGGGGGAAGVGGDVKQYIIKLFPFSMHFSTKK